MLVIAIAATAVLVWVGINEALIQAYGYPPTPAFLYLVFLRYSLIVPCMVTLVWCAIKLREKKTNLLWRLPAIPASIAVLAGSWYMFAEMSVAGYRMDLVQSLWEFAMWNAFGQLNSLLPEEDS